PRRNEPANQVLDGNDATEIFVSINDRRKTKLRGTQLLHDAVGELVFRGGCNPPHIIAQRFVSISVEQDVENVDQSGGLTVRCKHRKTIKTSRSAKLQRLLRGRLRV